MSRDTQPDTPNPSTGQTEVARKELAYLSKCLKGASVITSVAIIGSPIGLLADVVGGCLRDAKMFLIVQSARELEALRERELRRISTVVGMDFDAIDRSVDLTIVRVSGYEGKETIRRRLRSAARRTEPGSTVIVLTHTKRGASTQLGMLGEIFGNGEIVMRGGGGIRILAARVTADKARDAFDAAPAAEVSRICEEILGERFEFVTSAAVFSRERIDSGTRLLLETVPDVSPRTILDFGCGYGVMGIVLARRFASSRVTMIDSDVGAIELARTNAALNGVDTRSRVVLSDGLDQVQGDRFDLAVIHFPLHIPRQELERLLKEIHDALEPNGCLYGVMLNAYELRPTVERVFGSVETVRESLEEQANSAYTIVRACR